MRTEPNPLEEEQTQVYCFHHLLLLEYTAAKYVSTLNKVLYEKFLKLVTLRLNLNYFLEIIFTKISEIQEQPIIIPYKTIILGRAV